jgi:sugar phosphate isomerase/epimerase
MKFGMPTLVECDRIKDCIDVALENGLDFIEINLSFPVYQGLTEEEISAMKRLVCENKLFFTIHADEQLNPFDFNKTVSDCYFSVMRDTIRLAKELKIPVINMHLLKGVYVTLPGKVILLTDVYKEEYIQRVKEFIAFCETEIGESDIKIAIENVDSNAFTSSQLTALEFFMKSDKFGLTLDVGHEMCLNNADTHVFEEHPGKLVHMHLHDSNGKSAHLPVGSANVPISEKLSLLDDNSTCLIEVKTIAGLKESISYLKNENLFK